MLCLVWKCLGRSSFYELMLHRAVYTMSTAPSRGSPSLNVLSLAFTRYAYTHSYFFVLADANSGQSTALNLHFNNEGHPYALDILFDAYFIHLQYSIGSSGSYR